MTILSLWLSLAASTWAYVPPVATTNDSAAPMGAPMQVAGFPGIAKGIQSSTGATVQELKDAGRVHIVWTANRVASTQTAEGLFTLQQSIAGAAQVNKSNYTITSGKTLRFDSFSMTAEAGGTVPAVARVVFRLRYATGGGCTAASPLQLAESVSVIATAKTDSYIAKSFPNGFEFYGDGTKALCWSIETPDWVTTTVIPNIILSLEAYEY